MLATFFVEMCGSLDGKVVGFSGTFFDNALCFPTKGMRARMGISKRSNLNKESHSIKCPSVKRKRQKHSQTFTSER
jgi:hypothetical protein